MQQAARKYCDATKERHRHKAAVQALQHTSHLLVATATVEVAAPIIDRTCDLRTRVCSFIAEPDMSFTIAQPPVELCKTVASDKTALKLSISNQHASYMNTHGIAKEFILLLEHFIVVVN